jgi:hypothetical protein
MNGKICRGPDPSQSYLGLAAWIAALDQMQPENHGGLSYTVDVDVTASAGARFEFVYSIVNTVDSGFASCATRAGLFPCYDLEGRKHASLYLSYKSRLGYLLAICIA